MNTHLQTFLADTPLTELPTSAQAYAELTRVLEFAHEYCPAMILALHTVVRAWSLPPAPRPPAEPSVP